MNWSYRVLRLTWPNGAVSYGVHEVYHNPDGTIKGWTADPILPRGGSEEELRSDMGYFTRALALPALTPVSGTLVEVLK